MPVRQRSREYAAQMLFQWEMRHETAQKIERSFWKHTSASQIVQKFANQLFEGVAGKSESIDALLEKHSDDWKLGRIPAIDRAILRLAVWELEGEGTPPKVAITQALDLAKIYSSEASFGFINAVLDSIAKEQRAAAAKQT